jgi:hypothetical protein
MRFYRRFVGPFVLLSASTGVVIAGEASGSSPLLCAVTHSMACESHGDCVVGPPNAVNLPVFLKIDPVKKVIETAREGGERRTSKVLNMTTEGDTLALVGFDQHHGWSAAIDKVTGNMTVTATKQGVGFIAFGTCLPL